MTAASGILHKEYHEARWARQGGPFQMAQLWVNLPSANKMDPPRYQGLQADQMGIFELPGSAGLVRVVAGELQGVKGPAKTFTPVSLFDVRLNAGGRLELDVPSRQNLGLLVMKGQLTINGEARAATHDFVVFANAGEHVVLEATSEAQALVMGGEPIGEPIIQYGPFVMNTPGEIEKAFADLQGGKFGYLED
jgi:redox-sensitive bicupin YhaK (pirin superfamily)